jgi:hypothetical protein
MNFPHNDLKSASVSVGTTRYARGNWAGQRAGDDFELVRLCTGPDVLLPAALAQALRQWRGLQTPDGYIARVANNETAANALRQQLEQCVQHGLLVPAADILTALDAGESRTPNRVTTLAMVTRDRPQLLRRALESYIGNVVHYGRTVSFRIMDDSTQPAAVEENRHTVATLSQRYGVSIEHVDAAQSAVFAEELVRRSGVAPEVVNFALFGAYGANRNRLSLRTVGEKLICADDDTICDFRGESVPGWDVETLPQRDTWHFSDRSSAFSYLPPVAVDLIGLYEPVLGARPSDLLTGLTADALGSHTMEPPTLRRLLNQDARVLYCMVGIAGDCAQSNPATLTASGSSRARIFETPESYALSTRSREVVRRVRRPLLTTSTSCMAYCLGLDNQVITPPFFTRNRNSDGVYGFTLSMLYPDGLHAEFPHAIVHDPSEQRSFNGVEAVQTCYRVGTCDLVMAAVRDASMFGHGTDAARRLGSIGRDLVEMTSGSLYAFEQSIRGALNKSLAARADILSRLLREHGGEPKFWADDVRRGIEGLHRRIADSSPVVPADRSEQGDALEICQSLQRDVQLYGRVMTEWETLRHVAAEIYAERGDGSA